MNPSKPKGEWHKRHPEEPVAMVSVPKAVVENAMKCLFAAGALASGYNKPHSARAFRDAYLALHSAFMANEQSDEQERA